MDRAKEEKPFAAVGGTTSVVKIVREIVKNRVDRNALKSTAIGILWDAKTLDS